MTPQEKADELIAKFIWNPQTKENMRKAHHAAALCVHQIIEVLDAFGYSGAMYDDFETGQITTTDELLPEVFWVKVLESLEKSKNVFNL